LTAADALAAYERGERALQQGDWSGYGQAQADLQRILEAMAAAAGQAAPAGGSTEQAPLEVVGTPAP
jgi:hypothetical protein